MNDPRETLVEQLFGVGRSTAQAAQDRFKYEFLLIKALDDDASLRYSNQTDAWYVRASITVTDGEIQRGAMGEHQATPWEATQSLLHELQQVDGLKERIVTEKYGQRRYWVWNGAAWRELPK